VEKGLDTWNKRGRLIRHCDSRFPEGEEDVVSHNNLAGHLNCERIHPFQKKENVKSIAFISIASEYN